MKAKEWHRTSVERTLEEIRVERDDLRRAEENLRGMASELIRHTREANLMSVTEIARRLDVNRSTVYGLMSREGERECDDDY